MNTRCPGTLTGIAYRTAGAATGLLRRGTPSRTHGTVSWNRPGVQPAPCARDEDDAVASRLLRTHVAVAVVAVLGFLAVPDGSLTQTLWQVACGWFAAA